MTENDKNRDVELNEHVDQQEISTEEQAQTAVEQSDEDISQEDAQLRDDNNSVDQFEESPEEREDCEQEGDNPMDDDVETTIDSVVEAILFASDEPLTKQRLVKIAELSSSKQVSESVKALNKKYRENHCSFRIERIAGGYQMMTLPIYNSWLKKMLKVKTDSKLSQAALETLAIIAYKQPIIRADVEAIRGVASGEIIRSLMYKGLVKIVGRAEVIGRPLLYGTTKKFLEVFGLNSIKDLPDVEELKKPLENP